MRNTLKKIFDVLPLVGFIGALALIYYLMDSENSELKTEINSLNKQLVEKDSAVSGLYSLIDQSQTIIEKLKGKTLKCPPTYGFELDGRTMSSNELLDLLLNTWNEKDSLKNELDLRIELLKRAEINWGIQVFQDKDKYGLKLSDNSKISADQTQLDNLKFVLEELKRRYTFNYELRKVDGQEELVIPFNRLDSALMLYPHFKDRMKRDKNSFIITKCN